MVRLAFVIALATCICPVFAQNLAARQPWFLNVTVGGIFDKIPQCSKACTLGHLEASGCDPLDTACFCPILDMATGLDSCLAWYCPVLDYYDGLYLYHSTCNTPVRNAGPRLTREMIAVAAIALLAVILRFITRLPPLSILWGADDWLAVLLVLVGGGYLVVILLAIDSGLGQDIWLLSPQKVSEVVKYFTFEELGYVAITFLTKINVLTFYLRIFPIGQIRPVTYLFIGICIGLLVSIFLAHLLQCLPIAFVWEQWQGTLIQQSPDVTCGVQRDNLNWAFGITNVILDGIIMVLPIPKLMSLELRWRRKLGLMFVFCVGFLIMGIGIVKLVILLQFDFSYNRTWSNVPVVKWCAIEAFLSIALTCFPQIHLLGKRIIGIWYKFDHHSQHNKPSFGSSNTAISHPTKTRAMYENIEMGLK